MSINTPDTSHATDANPQPTPRCIIVTTQPELFTPGLSAKLNRGVSLFKTGAEATSALLARGCDRFYADFRQLEDGWTGQRFLRFVRAKPEFASVEFWLLAENWYPSQEQWAMKCGAAGMLKRAPQVLTSHILGTESPRMSVTLELQLDSIDDIFGRYAGPMRVLHVQAARTAMLEGRIESTRDAYVNELASRFTLPERREAFMKAVWADAELNLDVETTQPGDPWMSEVNEVFRHYAGALGARIIISRTLDAVERKGNHERNFYVNELSSGLNSPARRADFLSAAKGARLIH